MPSGYLWRRRVADRTLTPQDSNEKPTWSELRPPGPSRDVIQVVNLRGLPIIEKITDKYPPAQRHEFLA